jgi:hypothetical protein
MGTSREFVDRVQLACALDIVRGLPREREREREREKRAAERWCLSARSSVGAPRRQAFATPSLSLAPGTSS